MGDITISQSEYNSWVMDILRSVNEKIPIYSIANGFQNHELRSIVGTQNDNTLSEATYNNVKYTKFINGISGSTWTDGSTNLELEKKTFF